MIEVIIKIIFSIIFIAIFHITCLGLCMNIQNGNSQPGIDQKTGQEVG